MDDSVDLINPAYLQKIYLVSGKSEELRSFSGDMGVTNASSKNFFIVIAIVIETIVG